MRTLMDVVDFYNRGGDHGSMSFAVAADPKLIGATLAGQWVIDDTSAGRMSRRPPRSS